MFECRHSATGRLGYHATDYKTYKTIKQLNAWRIDAYRRRASWTRWFNKQPQNRRIEPHWTDRDRKMLRELEKIAIGVLYGTVKRVYEKPPELAIDGARLTSLAKELNSLI